VFSPKICSKTDDMKINLHAPQSGLKLYPNIGDVKAKLHAPDSGLKLHQTQVM
jgi:hypothetical protein